MYPLFPPPPGEAARPSAPPAFDYYADGHPLFPPASAGLMPAPYDTALPETLQNPTYVPGYLRTQIGKAMRVEFFVGNQMTDRVGILTAVGASYILLSGVSAAATIMCDLFSIKFVTIINSDITNALLIP